MTLASLMLVTPLALASDTLAIFGWADYMAPDTLTEFQRRTGIATRYTVYDTNEVMDQQMRSSKNAYDVVFPSVHVVGEQIRDGLLQPLDRSRLPHWNNLNPALLRLLESGDPGNRYGFPYLWGTTGIGYDLDKVTAALGPQPPIDSWDLLFKPENLAKLKDCGVAILDNGTELIPLALNYLGLSPHSTEPGDYRKAEELLMKMKPYVRSFNSLEYAHDLASGKICVAVGFSGDVLQAAELAQRTGKGTHIGYSVPREGTTVWFDMIAIPTHAPNPDAAYAFLNYLLEPQVIADITNTTRYANANEEADELVNAGIRSDAKIYPTADVFSRLFTLQKPSADIAQLRDRIWHKVSTGR